MESLLEVDIVDEDSEAPETIDITEDDSVYSNRNRNNRQYVNTNRCTRPRNSVNRNSSFPSTIRNDKPRYEMPPVLLLSSPECSPPNSPNSITICSSPEVYAVSPSPPGSPLSVRMASPVQDSLGGPVSPEAQANDPLLSSCIPSEEDPADTLFRSSIQTDHSCLSADNNDDSNTSVSEVRATDDLLGFPEPPDVGEPLLGFAQSADNNFDSSLLEFQSPAGNHSKNSILSSVPAENTSKFPVPEDINLSKSLPMPKQADNNDNSSTHKLSVSVEANNETHTPISTSVGAAATGIKRTEHEKSGTAVNDKSMDQDVPSDPLSDTTHDFDVVVSSPEPFDDPDSPEPTNGAESPEPVNDADFPEPANDAESLEPTNDVELLNPANDAHSPEPLDTASAADDISILEPSAENDMSLSQVVHNQHLAEASNDPLSVEAVTKPPSQKHASSADVDPLSTDILNKSPLSVEAVAQTPSQKPRASSADVDPLSTDIMDKSSFSDVVEINDQTSDAIDPLSIDIIDKSTVAEVELEELTVSGVDNSAVPEIFSPVVSEVFSISGISFPASTVEKGFTPNTSSDEPITLSDSPTPVSLLQVKVNKNSLMKKNVASTNSANKVTNSSLKKKTVSSLNKKTVSSINKKTASVPATKPLSVKISTSSENSKSISAVESSSAGSSSPTHANSTDLAPESPPSPGSMAIPNLSASNLSATYVSELEKDFYKKMFKDFSEVKYIRLHCTICDEHIGCAANSNAFSHRILRVLVCKTCYIFYGSGEFQSSEEDGSEIFCRWCGQGGSVLCCSKCPNVFCQKCIRFNFGARVLRIVKTAEEWNCFACDLEKLWEKRAVCHALVNYTNKLRKTQPKSLQLIDESICCSQEDLDVEERAEEKKKKSKLESLSAVQKTNDVRQKFNNTLPRTYPPKDPNKNTMIQKANNNNLSKNLNKHNVVQKTINVSKDTNKQDVVQKTINLPKDTNNQSESNTTSVSPHIKTWEIQKKVLGSNLVKLLSDDRNIKTGSANVTSASNAQVTQSSGTTTSILSSVLSTPTPSTVIKQPVVIQRGMPDPKLNFRNPMYRPNTSQATGNKTLSLSNCKIIGNVIVGNKMHTLTPSTTSSTVFRVAQNANSSSSMRLCYPGASSAGNKTYTVPRPMLSVPSSDNLGLRFQTPQKTTYNDVFAAKVLGADNSVSTSTPRYTTLSGAKLQGLNFKRNPAYHTVQLSNGPPSFPVNDLQSSRPFSSIPARIVSTPSAKTVTSYSSSLAGGLTVPATSVLSLAPNQLYAVDGGQIAIINDSSYQTAARKTVETGITQFMTGVAGQSQQSNIQVTGNTPQSEIDIKHDWFRSTLEESFSVTGIVLSYLVTLGKSFYEAEVCGSVEDMKTITGKMHRLLSKASEKFGDIDKKLGRHFRTWDRKITRQSKLCKKLRVVQPEQQKTVNNEHNYSSSKPSGKSNTEVIEVTPDLLLPEVVLDAEKEDSDSSSPSKTVNSDTKVPEYSHSTPFLFESPKSSTNKEVDISGTGSVSEILEIIDSDAEEDKENTDKTLDDKDCWPPMDDCEDDNIWDDSRKTSGTMNLQDIIKSSFSRAMKLKSENANINKSKMKDFSIQADLRSVTRSLSTQTLISSPMRSSSSNSPQKRPLPTSNKSFFNPSSPKKSIFATTNARSLKSSFNDRKKVSKSNNVNNKKPVTTDDETDDDDIKEVTVVDNSFKKNVYMNNIGLSVKKPVVLIKKIETSKLLTLADRIKVEKREAMDDKIEQNISNNTDSSEISKSTHTSQNVSTGKGIRIKITRQRDGASTSQLNSLPRSGSDSRKRKRDDSISSTNSHVNGIDCISVYSDSGSESPAPKRVRLLDSPTKPCSVKLLKLKENDLRALAAKNCVVKLEKLTDAFPRP